MLAQGSVGSQAPLTHSSLLVAYPGQCLLLGKYSSELRVSLSFCTGHVTSNQQRLVLVPAMVYGIMLCPRACWMLSSVVTVVSFPLEKYYFPLEKASCDLQCVVYLGERHSWL